MTKEFIRHAWRTRRDQIAAGSYLNCHVKGMHSVMFINAPDAIVRMFFTTPDHLLHQNLVGPLSIAFHCHDSELTLVPVKGQLVNIAAADHARGMGYRRFLYKSRVRDGSGAFFHNGAVRRLGTVAQWMSPGDSRYMPASEYHTVSVPAGERSAWFVLEGAKDPTYQAIAYSDVDLTTFDDAGLYLCPTVDQLGDMLSAARLL